MRAAGLLTFLTTSLSAAPGPCGNPSAYDGYKVTRVAVIDPIGFLAPWTSLSASLKTGLKIAQNQPFSSADFNADTTALNDRLEGQFASSTQRVKLSYAYGDIVDCDPAAQSLRVVYTAITTVIPSLISSAEEQLKETVSPATTGAARAEGSGAQVSALTGYNETRGTLGGLSFADTTGILQIQGESEVSANSRTGNLNLGGSIAPHRTLLDSAVWAGTFDYRGVPVGSARFGEGTLSARFSALSKESGAGHSLFRYGAALEGGHQQSTESGATASLLPDSRYGAMKLFAGVTGRPGKQAYTASYGLQLGSTFLNNAPVFTKHLVDLGYSTRVPLPGIKPYADTGPFTGPLSAGVHRSLGIETRFTGGLIQGATGAPLAERFFGGNAVAPFVPDASWVIQSDAFIRSIPENRLGAGNGTAPYGGSRFYSGNATLSYTLFGKPLLPKEMADDPDFPGVLNAPFDTAVSALSNSYKTKDPEYARLTASISAMARDMIAKLTALAEKLKDIPATVASQQPLSKQASAVRLNIITQSRPALTLIASGPRPQVVTQLVTVALPALGGLTQELSASLRAASQPMLASDFDALIADIAVAGRQIQNAQDNLPTKKYDDEAEKTLAPGRQAINVFLHELNIYSIAPVGIFDIARVWPTGEGVHYGVGGGLRLSLANANFTFGYAFNPRRLPQEAAGALFFKLDVTSLF